MSNKKLEETLEHEVKEAEHSSDETRRRVADTVRSSGLVGKELGRAEDLPAMELAETLAEARTMEQIDDAGEATAISTTTVSTTTEQKFEKERHIKPEIISYLATTAGSPGVPPML
jgi:hypothetical protein